MHSKYIHKQYLSDEVNKIEDEVNNFDDAMKLSLQEKFTYIYNVSYKRIPCNKN
jgi:hypothetical protein